MNKMMWKYGNNPSREYVDQRLRFVEQLFESYGAVPLDINQANRNRLGQRITYLYNNEYFRVDCICFGEKPFIVIEWTDDSSDAAAGSMEDVKPFPYDFPDWIIEKEVRFACEIEPYPETYPDY